VVILFDAEAILHVVMTAREATRRRDSSQLQISFQNQEQCRIVRKNFRHCDDILNR
jgi:hypothetical protein